MKREDLLAQGMTEEQVTFVLNSFHTNAKNKDEEIAKLKQENSKYSDYENIKSQLDEINKANMSEQEKLAEREKAIATKEAETNKLYNTAKAKEILTKSGLSGEELDKLVSTIVGADEATTVNNANVFLNTFNSMKENTIKSTKEELINLSAKPNGSNDPNNNSVMTWDKYVSLSVEEQNKFAAEHPEEFSNL